MLHSHPLDNPHLRLMQQETATEEGLEVMTSRMRPEHRIQCLTSALMRHGAPGVAPALHCFIVTF